jgi:uncharacterized damage-inducible protein DinB
MNAFYEAYLERLEWLHAEIKQSVQGLPQEALDWSPGKEMNSMAVLVTHLAGAERYWIGDVAAGEPSGRDREAEFRVRGLPRSALEERLQQANQYARQTLERFSLEDLQALRISPRDGEEINVAWCLLHAIQHTGMHLGHIQLNRQLWEQKDQGG